MAYSTGTVQGTKALYDALGTWLTSSAGWTLHDTLNSVDKVYTSPGLDGYHSHVARLTIEKKLLNFDGQATNFTLGEKITGFTSAATARVMAQTDAGSSGTLDLIDVSGLFLDNEYITGGLGGDGYVDGYVNLSQCAFRDRDNMHNAADWILMRGYGKWNASTDVGTSEFGRWGPWLMECGNNSTAANQFWKQKAGTVPNQAFYNYFDNGIGMGVSSCFFRKFDGIRRIWSSARLGNTTVPGFLDIPQNSYRDMINIGAGDISGNINTGCYTYDKVTGKWYWWQESTTSTETNKWIRYDFDAHTSSIKAPPNINVNGATSGNHCVWDGGDYIYLLVGGSSTGFGRYKISTDSWTTMTAAPSVTAGGSDYTQMLYIAAGTIPGIAEDIIYASLNGGSTLSRYNVASNTWSGSISLALSVTSIQNPFTYDGYQYLYQLDQPTNDFYRLNLFNIPAGWTFLSGWEITSQYTQPHQIDHFVGKIHSSAEQNITYWFIGDADSFKVVTKLNDHYWWAYFGKIDSYYKESIMKVTSAASPGTPSTISVDSTAAFAVNDPIIFFNPSTGLYDASTIVEIVNATTLKAFLTIPLAIDSKITVDGLATIVTGDSWMAVANYDGGGFEKNKDASNYRLKPLVASDITSRSTPSARGRTQLWPYLVYANESNLTNFENRGVLLGVYSLDNNVAPAPQSEDIVTDGGLQYKVFKIYSTKRSADDRAIAVGPIN